MVDFRYMSGFMDAENWIIALYMNFYFCNGALIVPLEGEGPDKDADALALLAKLLPDRQIVSVTLHVGP